MDLQKELDLAIKNYELRKDPSLQEGCRISEEQHIWKIPVGRILRWL